MFIPALHTQTKAYAYRCCVHQYPRQRRSYATTSSPPDIYDVVCVGGGPAGLSLLSALRSSPTTSNLRIALIESQQLHKYRPFSAVPTNFSNRCSSLTPSTVRFLKSIGAWAHLKFERVQPYHAMQVWDGVSGARIGFNMPANEAGKVIAYMSENSNLVAALLSRLDELGNVDVFDNVRVDAITLGQETDELDLRSWPVVRLQGGRRLAARLLVGADGANSPVRAFAGIDSTGWDYDRVGVVATLRMGCSGQGGVKYATAYQRFLPTGPVAMLPLPGNFSSLVWSTKPALSARLKSLKEEDFLAMVNAAFRLSVTDLSFMHTIDEGQKKELEWRLRHTSHESHAVPRDVVEVQEGSIASFPLRIRHVDTYIGERIALVGDAAHLIHPLAGQGLNQGQGDVESLARAIEHAVTHGQDIGVQMSLESYNQERYAANNALLGAVDKLHKLYAVGSGPVVSMRSLGLKAVDAISPLKHFFMKQASGTGLKML